MRKRRISRIILVLALCLGLMSSVALASESPVSTWADAVTDMPAGYTESDNTVTISTAEELAWFAKQVNTGADYSAKTVKLSADIDLSGRLWSPIGTTTYLYKGTFDGGKYSISGLNVDITSNGAGLFGVVGGGTTIKDLEVSGTVKTSGKYAGGIVGYSSGSGTVTIENCGNNASVTAGGANAAGIIGCCDGSKATFTIKNCYNIGTISGGTESAAISGWLGNNATVKNCWNSGTVSGIQSGRSFARFSSATFTNCYQLKSVGLQSSVTAIQPEDVSSGALAVMLGSPWGQNLDGEGTPDAHPVLNGAAVYTGYSGSSCKLVYSNSTDGLIQERPNHDADYDNLNNGRCGVCSEANPDSVSGKGMDLTTMTAVDEKTWSWDPDTKTLTLKGITISSEANPVMTLPDDTTIVLQEGTENEITATLTSNIAISCPGNLTIVDSDPDNDTIKGKLTVSTEGEKTIYCENLGGTAGLTIDGVELVTRGGDIRLPMENKTSTITIKDSVVDNNRRELDTSCGEEDGTAACIIRNSTVTSGKINVRNGTNRQGAATLEIINSHVDAQMANGSAVSDAIQMEAKDTTLKIKDSYVRAYSQGWGDSGALQVIGGTGTATVDVSESNLLLYGQTLGLDIQSTTITGTIEDCTIISYSKNAKTDPVIKENGIDVSDRVLKDSLLFVYSYMQPTSSSAPPRGTSSAAVGSPTISYDFTLPAWLGPSADLPADTADIVVEQQTITVADGVKLQIDEAVKVKVGDGASITGHLDANIVPQEEAKIVLLYCGEFMNVVSAVSEGKVQKPTDPKRQCHSFEGWYTDKSYATEYEFPRTITGPEYAYAKWSEAHTWDEGVVTQAPTTAQTGVRTYTCTGCGATKTESIPKLEPENSNQPSVGTFYPTTNKLAVEDNGDGKTTVTPANPNTDDTVTIIPNPNVGSRVGDITATDKNGNSVPVIDNGDGTYSFVQPAGKVTITVTYVCDGTHNCPSNAFADLDTHMWYHEATDFVLSQGLMNGIGNNLFDINGTTTRAMIVTILWRMEGEPAYGQGKSGTFADVPENTWYTEAVEWAAANGIVEGWNGKFDPTGDITREQFATILWRYAKYKGYDVSVGENTNILSYKDAFDISEYAIPAMQWACGSGLMEGDGVNLTPTANATRSQAAALLMRFCALDK